MATATVSDVTIAYRSIAVPGPVFARASSSYATVGVVTYWAVRHSALTSTFLGRFPSSTSVAKSRTVLSDGVVLINGGVTYCTPQRVMICVYGLYKHIRSRGRPVSANFVILSRRDLGDVPFLSLSRVNSAWKAPRHRYCWPEDPTASRV